MPCCVDLCVPACLFEGRAGNSRHLHLSDGIAEWVTPTSHELGNSRLSDVFCIWYRVLRRVGSSHILTHPMATIFQLIGYQLLRSFLRSFGSLPSVVALFSCIAFAFYLLLFNCCFSVALRTV
ncbi:hypothetical protein F511_30290 [Dorcoceras hygrometricum]|uniref:Uncharacterized protein n=1 Tax=Dorcoceras hygrometricum TaxID=472368 RepID=A0A2Z7BYR7_9LAMI|nr:hypothetical protein F511_30290 [Dorcoceras hygrometricum]